jgi:hypothetical protein
MSDDFNAALTLLQMAVDAAATRERLNELRAATADARQAQSDLAAAQAEHAAAVARDRAEIEAEKTAIAERWTSLRQQSGALDADRDRIKEFREMQRARSTEVLAGGLVRDWGSPEARAADLAEKVFDPHFPRSVGDPKFEARDAETVTEPVPNAPAGSTLTRSRPPRRRPCLIQETFRADRPRLP